MSSVYPIDNTVYENARTDAKQRAIDQWNKWMMDKTSINMWTTYPTTLNTNWIDPWFESEAFGIENDPNTGYQQTQNAYMVYCWLSYKGYNKYSQQAIMAVASHESTLTGGAWEAGNHPYPSLTSFDPTSYNLHGVPSGYTRMSNWSNVWRYGSSGNIIWRPTVYDQYTQQLVSLNCDNTWAAIKRYPIAMETVEIEGVSYTRPVYNEYGEPILDISSPGRANAGNGYGLFQFTPWTKLPRTCVRAYLSDGIEDFNEANRHWQLNLTLQLMIVEFQRNQAMNHRPQSGNDYFGQWVDSNASLVPPSFIEGAYFQWPYNPSSSQNKHWFGQSITWDQFAAGTYLEWFDNYIQTMANPPVSEADKDWCKRQLALHIWRACYEQADYPADYGFRERTEYFLKAIEYWDANGGYSVADIPRARDIPTCELDNYHMSAELLITIPAKKRGRNRVRTILL